MLVDLWMIVLASFSNKDVGGSQMLCDALLWVFLCASPAYCLDDILLFSCKNAQNLEF
jgi:hypothetical protein